MTSRLACPDCGTELVIKRLANGTHTCHCPDDRAATCRADVMGHGKTADEAADKFVQRCERYGYTTALELKLKHAADCAETERC